MVVLNERINIKTDSYKSFLVEVNIKLFNIQYPLIVFLKTILKSLPTYCNYEEK